jgi:hypothetical protein
MRMSRYSVLHSVSHLCYGLTKSFANHATELCAWLPERIKQHINARVGIIPQLVEPEKRLKIAAVISDFMGLINQQIDHNPTSFEIVSFALIKIHLEKFACKIYRDTRTSAHDRGVDLATNFGVVYQVKKLRVRSKLDADKLYAELRLNFDSERLQDGNVILVIDDIAEDVRRYLIDMKVQSIKREQLLGLAAGFSDVEDRQKVLRVIYEEFRRDSRMPAPYESSSRFGSCLPLRTAWHRQPHRLPQRYRCPAIGPEALGRGLPPLLKA